MAYDKKYRENVMKFIEKGHSIREAAKIFAISTSTIMGWRKLHHQTGSLAKRSLERTHKKIDPVELEAYYEQNPDSYLSEAAEYFGCSVNAIFKAIKRLRITRKKN